MVDTSQTGRIDRSELFRHRSDYPILRAYAEGRFLESPANSQAPIRGLDVGVGHLEEPLSILATREQLARELQVRGFHVAPDGLLNLDLVDSRSRGEIKPKYSLGVSYGSGNAIIGGAFLDDAQKRAMPNRPCKPRYVVEFPAAFELKDGEYWFTEPVISSARKALESGRLSTPVQTLLREEGQPYDVIFCNNVVQHLGNEGEQVAEGLTKKLLKKGGLVFLHITGNIGDTKSVLGTARLIDGNSRFNHLERVGPAAYFRKD